MPSGRRHYRLTLADALAAHEPALTYGVVPGIINLHSIRSAAALIESVARNHGFTDGNKRRAHRA